MADVVQTTNAAKPRPGRYRQPYATGIAGAADGVSRLGWGEGGAVIIPFALCPEQSYRGMCVDENFILEGI
jgi:hypothetical protein